MKEIIAYKTSDGKKYYEKEKALEHETRTRMKKFARELVNEAVVLFKEELTEEKDSRGEKFYYFKENGTTYWDGEEDLEDIDSFIEFLIDVASSHGGKTLALMNKVKEISEK